MKQMIFLGFISILLLLTACNSDGGNVYNHLQQQDPSGVRSYDQANDPNPVKAVNETELLCEENPHCCNEFTSEEKYYYDMEQRAIIENKVQFCHELPEESLLVTCPNETTYAYYSKNRCLAHFE